MPKAYDPKAVEGPLFASWQAGGYFSAEIVEGVEPYSVVIPPPNVTGSLHMGHALNNTIQDVVVRRSRMTGRPTVWVVGTDHAGIATQNKVEQKLHRRGQVAPRRGPRGVHRGVLGVAPRVRRHHHRPAQGDGLQLRLRQRALHDGPELRSRGPQGVRGLVRGRADLQGQAHHQLVPALLDGALRHRGRARGRRQPPLAPALPAQGAGRRRRPRRRRDHAAGDDARRHLRGRAPGRRALLGARGRDGRAAAHGPRDPDRRRRLRGPGVRLRRGQGHAGARPQRLRHRRAPRLRQDQHHERRRDHLRGGRRLRRARPLRGPQARAGRPRGARRAGQDRRARPLGGPLLPLPHGHRAVALGPVVRRHEAARRAGDRGRARRSRDVPPQALGERLLPLDGQHPRLVHLSAAVVGAPDPGVLLRRLRHDGRQHGRPDRVPHVRGSDAAGRGRARHVVLLAALAVRHARLARAHARGRLLLPDQRAVDRARHPVPVGRPHGHERHVLQRRRRSRSRTSSSTPRSSTPRASG